MMLRDEATYWAYATGWQAVRRMPESAAYGAFQRIADQQWRARSGGVRRLEANLARVLGPVAEEDLRAASRAGMRSYMRYWCDTFRLPGWDEARLDSFQLHGNERIAEAVASGRGAVVALPHTGNWDHAGAWVSRAISPVTTVAERLRPERLFDAFVGFRTAIGMHIHGLGEPGVYQRLCEVAAEGGVVALLADRDLSAKGIGVRFFGEDARFPAGPAALAVDTGAVLLPVTLFREGEVNAGQVHDALEPPAGGDRVERIATTTQLLADVFERGIAEHPADWHMLQRLWLADLDPARLAASDAAGQEP